MDAVSDNRHVPLCIDLDGTLITTDTLWEGLVSVLIRRPWLIFAVVAWAMSGKAVLKREVAARYQNTGGDWPYRAEVIERIQFARNAGQPVWLVTGAAESTAKAIAAHLGLFDRVLHSSDSENLTSRRKRERLVALCGDGGFDYAGNSHDDVTVFDAARRAIIVAPDKAARRWGRKHDAEVLPLARVSPLTIFKSIRVHQWLKNVLIAVPLVLNHEYAVAGLVFAVFAAFFSFSFLASAVYIINDIADLANDRKHPRKRLRPLASGAVSIPVISAVAVVLVVASVGLASLLPPQFWGVLCLYAVITTAYTFVLKRKLLVDVFTLAGLYTVRIIAGAAATGVDLSFWLLAFSIFFFLSLALVKRFVELDELADDDAMQLTGRSYMGCDKDMIGQAGVASAFSAAMVLALYVDSKEVASMYPQPALLWPLCPLILYMLLRIWVLARRSQMHEDPVVFIMRDWRSQMTTVAGACLVFLATWKM
ncbi:4-hydroxybenzoate polyprenyltransferase-like prenyltransferase [Hoeflea sp. IMCC20628]|uniref:UbiA family prenyltransferase n=1 Tax=Hoeflea sp. IMCC20628 TaxID=1620421 RepID=UPI00063AE633|nr:UbiA family prenyltransferase [Hoeflea sp. IMCC20628]AKI02711.1 4-hydroxybenzoate polyprenyltransferase-like prenyltransferase [Hoeflea sp. IMCC20628]